MSANGMARPSPSSEGAYVLPSERYRIGHDHAPAVITLADDRGVLRIGQTGGVSAEYRMNTSTRRGFLNAAATAISGVVAAALRKPRRVDVFIRYSADTPPV